MTYPEKESGGQKKGLFDSDEDLTEKERSEIVEWVELTIREEKFPEAQARELRNAAEFIMDMAYSVEDARKQVVERKNWIARDLRIQKLRGDVWSENEKLTVYITDQLVGCGYTSKSIFKNFCAPFADAYGRVPEKLSAAVERLLSRAFAPDQLPNILTDTILLSLVDSEDKSLPCKQITLRIESFLLANLKFSAYFPVVEKEIPHVISFYWSGRAISKSALANVLAWVDRAKGTDWVIVMWSDLAISDWNTNAAGSTLTKAGVKVYEAQEVLDPRLRAPYQYARRFNLAGASDLVRLSLLRSPKCGGVYIDVDIAPGTINLKTLSCKATPLTLPLFGPMVRDLKGVRSILHLGSEIPVTKTEIDRAVAIQTERGNINNNFIVVQTDCIFMDPLINFIAGQLAQYEEGFWKASKDFIAAITGPGAILGVLPKILRIRDNVNEGEAVVIMNKNFVCTWPVEWITPDSEDQDWSPTKDK